MNIMTYHDDILEMRNSGVYHHIFLGFMVYTTYKMVIWGMVCEIVLPTLGSFTTNQAHEYHDISWHIMTISWKCGNMGGLPPINHIVSSLIHKMTISWKKQGLLLPMNHISSFLLPGHRGSDQRLWLWGHSLWSWGRTLESSLREIIPKWPNYSG